LRQSPVASSLVVLARIEEVKTSSKEAYKMLVKPTEKDWEAQ
jgi:hypothetical protein